MSSLFRQLLITKVQGSEPLPEGDFLLASSSKLLGVNPSTYFNYGNTEQLLANTLSGESGKMLKFDASFEVHSDLWETDGAREVLYVPNLLKFYADNSTPFIQVNLLGKQLFEIPDTERITGWNAIKLVCDGTHIYLFINGFRHTLYDCSDYTTITYYSMTANGLINIPAFKLGTGDWEVQIGLTFSAVSQQQYIYGGNSYYNCGIAMEANTSGSTYRIGIGTSPNGSTWNPWKWGTVDITPYLNKHILLKHSYDVTNKTVTIGYSFDHGATWIFEEPTAMASTVYQNTASVLQLGTTATDSGRGFRGKLYMDEFKVTTVDGVIFDGSKAVAGTDYTLVRNITTGTEESGNAPRLFSTIGAPDITQDRTKVKNISMVTTEEPAV